MRVRILFLIIVLLVSFGRREQALAIQSESELSHSKDSHSKIILEIDTGGHKATIRDVIFTKDGKYLVSVSDDKTIRVWDAETGEISRVIRGQIGEGHEGKIFAAALSPDNKLLAVGGSLAKPGSGNSGIIRIFNFQTGEVISILKGHENVIFGLAFSSDGRHLISGSGDKTARIWDMRGIGGEAKASHYEGGGIVLKGHREPIYAVALSPDSTLAVTGSDDNTLKLWDVRSGSLIKTMEGHTDKVVSAAFTPDGRYILSGSFDKTIRLWDGRDGRFIKILASQDSTVDSLSISPDGKRVVTGVGQGKGNTNNVFSIPSGELITSFSMHNNIVLATAISPDGNTIATGGGGDMEIYLWDINTGKVKNKMAGNGKPIWNVGFGRDGRTIAWGKMFEQENLFQRGSLEQGFRLDELMIESESGSKLPHSRGIESVGSLSIGTKDGKIHPTLQIIKNYPPSSPLTKGGNSDGRVIHEITRDAYSGYDHCSLTLTPDGSTVISGGGNGGLTSYNPDTGEKIHDFIGHLGVVWGVAVSPDSRLLVSGSSDQTVRLWEIGTGRLLLTIFHGEDNEWAAWIPEGYYTSSVNGDRYIGWHINQGEDKAALYYPASRFADKFYSPEIVSAYLNTGGDIDETIRLVNEGKAKQKIVKTEISDIQNIMPPAVFIQIPDARDITVSENSIRIKVVAKSLNKEPIKDIWILVNGRPLITRGVTIKGKETKEIQGLSAFIDMSVPLTEEVNRISVIASNQFTQSEPEVINVTWEKKDVGQGFSPAGDIYKPDLYILSIGISEYKNPDYRLDVAHKDAEAIVKVFDKQKGRLFKEVKGRLLINRDARRENILNGLDWVLKESTQKDIAVIFVAGHGLQDDRKNYYFLPFDGEAGSLRSTGVKWSEFHEAITSLPSKVILMVDTCHSGSVTGKRRGVTDMTDALRELVNAESGIVVMTASTGKEESQERKEWGHGAFTKALVDGLEGDADFDKDKVIDIKELDLFITKRVKELTGGAQHPTTEIPKTMPNFPIVFYGVR